MSIEADILARLNRLELAVTAMRPDRSAYQGRNGILITGSSGNMVVDGGEITKRLDAVEKIINSRLSTLERLLAAPQSVPSMLTQIGGAVSWKPIPASPTANDARTLDRMVLTMSDTVDDDVRIRLGGIAVYDPQQVLGQKRQITLSATEILTKGAPIMGGTIVQIDTYDGAAVSYSLRKWSAVAYYTNGTSRAFSGGSDYNGSSGAIPTYYNNGFFTL